MNNKMQQFTKAFAIVWYVLFTILMIVVISQKTNYHVDEIFSYGLANNRGSIDIDFIANKRYMPASKPFMDYMTVDKEDCFHYDIAWENQIHDVHPPLYYIVLHTISSIKPGSFSKWYAGGINIAFALLTLYVLRRYSMLLFSNKKSMQIVFTLLFIFSAGILGAAAFFRMYMMAMFWVTLLEYVFALEAGKEKSSWHFYVVVYLLAVLGALTHYYCIIFTVLLCAVYGVLLICQKRWKEIGMLVGTGILAGGSACCIFPAMIKHMFFGYRGKDTMENLKAPVSDYLNRLKEFYRLINNGLFGHLLWLWLVVAIVLAAIICIRKKNSLHKVIIMRYILLLVPILVYFILIAKIAVYMSLRYMYPIYAILLLGIFSLVVNECTALFDFRIGAIIAGGLAIIISIGTWKYAEWNYLYKDTEILLEASKEYEKLDCIYIYDARYKTQGSFMEVSNYKSVRFANGKKPEKMLDYDLSKKKEVIVMVTEGREEAFDMLLKNNPQYTGCDVLGSYQYTTTYHLYTKDS